MLIENSFFQAAGLESANTNSVRQQILSNLQQGKDYREGFVEEAINSRIIAQIHAIRIKNGMDYKQFAERIKRKLSWAYRLEDPNEAPPTIPSLLEVAAAFDIALDVRFCPFSELLNDVSTLDDGAFDVPTFTEELNSGAFSKPKKSPKPKGYDIRRGPLSRLQHKPSATEGRTAIPSYGARGQSGLNKNTPPSAQAA